MDSPITKIALLMRIADSVDMSFDIPNSEKERAEEALIRFEAALKRIRDAAEHLDILYIPLKRHENISTKSLVKKRGLLNRFKQKVRFNYNEVKAIALLAIRKLNYFANGDTAIQEIITSFIDAIDTLEEAVGDLLDAISDYESQTFRDDVMKNIDIVKQQTEKLEDLLKERIIDHIDTNILARTWMTDTSNKINLELEDRVPLISELADEREKALNSDEFPASTKQNQALNPSDAQRMYYGDRARDMSNVDGFIMNEFGGF